MADETTSAPSRPPETSAPEAPPRTWGATLRRLGPGMIIAGSIVGSGELIATTKTGAEAGFYLLWLIIIGCVIKVFTQVEFGRYTIAWGETPLKALDSIPGPRLKVNWILWYWAILTALVISQQGGIVGGVGQALAISKPLTQQGSRNNALQDQVVDEGLALAKLYKKSPQLWTEGITLSRWNKLRSAIDQAEKDGKKARSELEQIAQRSPGPNADSVASQERDALQAKLREAQQTAAAAQLELKRLTDRRDSLVSQTDAVQFGRHEGAIVNLRQQIDRLGKPHDTYLWAAIIAVITSVLLFVGRYGLIQVVATVLVGTFTAITIATLFMLQSKPGWAVSGQELATGLSFRLPPVGESLVTNPVATALGAFGIIGVGAIELIMYPYWCLEKGYAKYTGPRDGTRQWIERARGWMRVLHVDVWLSMVVYTFATVAFFLLGAAVLGRAGLNPEGSDMIRTLSEMYVPVFGSWAPPVFLFGAFAVLYSTYFVAAAGNARMIADALGLFGLTDGSEATRMWWTRIFSAIWPLVAFVVFWIVRAPAAMVLLCGIGQAVMLPMLGIAALYFRFRRCDENLRPGRLWDVLLWISFLGFVIAATWAIYSKLV